MTKDVAALHYPHHNPSLTPMDGRENEPAYITKYALTTGIIPCREGYFTEDGYYHGKPHGWQFNDIFNKKDAHRTLGAAMADAERRRLNKIASLEKQIERLRTLEIKLKHDD